MTGNSNGFKAVTVGWEPDFIDSLLSPISEKVNIDFVHGLVGDASRLNGAQSKYPKLKFLTLSKATNETLPAPDYKLLASLECVGVPTIRSMVQGDRVLRHLPADEVLGYATLLARRLREVLIEHRPDMVLGSYDSLHAALSLAVAKSLGIPWVAMAFTVIPDNLTGFCRGLTPDQLVPIPRTVNDQLREQAVAIIKNVRSKEQKVLAFRPPSSIFQWLLQYFRHGKNLFRRVRQAKALGVDKYTYPSIRQRLNDIVRRLVNRLRFPGNKMLWSPPQERFVYYPFHMAPESMIDTWAPFYQNQLALLAQVAQALPIDVALVVKLHFSDPDNYSPRQLKELMSLPRTHIAHPSVSGRVFLDQAALVIGITGTSCLEASLLGKPVVVFGDTPYVNFPRSERAKRPDELNEQIRRMLDQTLPSDHEIVEAYASYMARYMPGRINDWNRRLTEGELQLYADCFKALAAYISEPDNRLNWYKTAPFSSGL